MADVSALNAGLQGIHRGLADAQSAANRIVNPQVDEGAEDITVAAVDLLQAEAQVRASAEVLRTASNTVGTLIDVFS